MLLRSGTTDGRLTLYLMGYYAGGGARHMMSTNTDARVKVPPCFRVNSSA